MARDDNYFDKIEPAVREQIIQPPLAPTFRNRPATGYPSPYAGSHPHVRFLNPYIRSTR